MYGQQNLYKKKETSIPRVGFEPTILAGLRPQTYALDRAATGIGSEFFLEWEMFRIKVIEKIKTPSFLMCYCSFPSWSRWVFDIQGVHKRMAHGTSFLNRTRNSRWTVITDLDTSKRSTQKAFSCCDAILETGRAVSMRSELVVEHEKLGQLPLLTV